MNKLKLILALLLVSMIARPENSPYQGVEHFKKTKQERLQWFRDAKLGMFIHWGLYSVGGGYFDGKKYPQHYSEWIQKWAGAKTDAYAKEFAHKFTASKFDPNVWAKLASKMGVRYAVLTTKHHDGFTLFNTNAPYALAQNNPYGVNVNISPKGRDLVAEYAQAFRNQNIKVGLYYSVIDWQHPDSPSHQWLNQDKRTNNTPVYLDYMHQHLNELMSNYGKIDLLWADYSTKKTQGDLWRTKELFEMFEKKQPHIVVNNRFWDGLENPYGDYITPEKYVPETGYGDEAWEVCHTMNESFGFSYHDEHWKSAEEIFKILVDANSKGGNLLLNVGPDREGTIPPKAVTILEKFATYVQKYSSEIYGTKASQFSNLNFNGRSNTVLTNKDNSRLNFFVYEYPEDGVLVIDRLENKINDVYLTASKKSLYYVEKENELKIVLPHEKTDEFGWVVSIDIEGKPDVKELPYAIQSSDRNVVVRSSKFTTHKGLKVNSDRGIGGWTKEGQYANAEFKITKPGAVKHTGGTVENDLPGKYKVELEYAVANGHGGELKVSIADEEFEAEIKPNDAYTGGWFGKKKLNLGEITFKKQGVYKVKVEITDVNKKVMNFYGIKLTPID